MTKSVVVTAVGEVADSSVVQSELDGEPLFGSA
jgi:hypothetical protein